MADTYFVGLRGTDDLVANERPQSWRDGILRLFPNGMAPLTALTALMPSEKVTDVMFNWWTQTLTTQRAAVSVIATDTIGTVLAASSTAAGTVLYLTIPVADSKMFRQGHQVLLRDSTNYNREKTALVNSVTQASATTARIAVSLLEVDAATALTDLRDTDTVLVIGSMNPQGGSRPEAIAQQPEQFFNTTQIFRNSLDLSRTLMETKLRTEQAYQKAKRNALEQHSIEMEKAFFWGKYYVGVGSNGKPQTATRGLISFIQEYGGLVNDFSLDADAAYDGTAWISTGVEWLDEQLETIFRYGRPERLAFVGSGALLGIQRLIRSTGHYNIQARESVFGIKVLEWITAFGTLTLKTHPLFSYEPTNRNSMVIIDPTLIQYKYITDTTFMPDESYMKGGNLGIDGKQEEYLTECGLEIHHPICMSYLNGIGLDNPV